MDGVEFKARLRILRRTQVGFATEVGVAPRTVHYWAERGPPSEIAYLLDLLIAVEMPLGPGPAVSKQEISSSAFFDLVGSAIDGLERAAEALGRASEFQQGVRLWIERNHCGHAEAGGGSDAFGVDPSSK